MKFCDKLILLRRERGYSQEQLAQHLHVTRQSVSKWEAGLSMPDLSKLISLSDFAGVSLDYLVREEIENKNYPYGNAKQAGDVLDVEKQEEILYKLQELEKLQKEKVKEFEYVSRKKIFGVPLVHIHTKRIKGVGLTARGRIGYYYGFDAKAKGILAIGNCSMGVISIGLLSCGIFSLGIYSLGVLSLGIICAGFLAAGILAFGGFATGVVAIGGIALGVSAIGYYAVGVAALAKEMAIGVSASAKVAVGSQDAKGLYTLLTNVGTTKREVTQFLTAHKPDLANWLKWLLTIYYR